MRSVDILTGHLIKHIFNTNYSITDGFMSGQEVPMETALSRKWSVAGDLICHKQFRGELFY